MGTAARLALRCRSWSGGSLHLAENTVRVLGDGEIATEPNTTVGTVAVWGSRNRSWAGHQRPAPITATDSLETIHGRFRPRCARFG